MRRSLPILIGLLLVAPLCAQVHPKHHKTAHKSPPARTQPSPAAQPGPTVQPPPRPLTPEDSPASPPEVTLQNGRMTIVARNSVMADVLNAVRQKTGASIDTPGFASERVVGQFGPGAPRDVMAQLLNGSHFDYVLLGSASDPGALKRIVLTPKSSGPEPGPQPQQNNVSTYQQPLQAVPEVNTYENNDENNTVEMPPDIPQENDQGEPPQVYQQGDQQEEEPASSTGAPTVKTPQQLLQELEQERHQNGQPPPPQRQ